MLATADADGAPDARIVLIKGYDEAGFIFGTSYASTKGAQLAVNPRAALVFPWHALQRQVRVAGRWSGSGTRPPTRCGTRDRAARSWPPSASVQSTVVDSAGGAGRSGSGCSTSETADGPVPRPRSGAATGSCPSGWSSGRADRTGCTTGCASVRDDEEGGGWIVQRLAP